MLSKTTLERIDSILASYERDISKRGCESELPNESEISFLREIVQNEIESIEDGKML